VPVPWWWGGGQGRSPPRPACLFFLLKKQQRNKNPTDLDAEAALKTTTKNLQVLRDRFAKLNEEHLKLKQLHESVPNSPTAATNGEGAALAGYLGDVVGAVQALFNSPKFSDIVLVIDNKRIPAHKFLLKARSKFFRDTAAAAIDDVAEFAVEEEGVSADIFLLLLRFLYTDAIDFASVNDVVGVQMLALADTHGLGSLRSAMESTLVSLLSRKNCTRLFFEANRLGAKELRQVRAADWCFYSRLLYRPRSRSS